MLLPTILMMKYPFFFCPILLLIFLSSASVFGQANVTSSGISVQGIARDENNTALANEDQLSLKFKIYYLDNSNSEQTILNKTGNVRTDAFGVFAYVIDVTESAYMKIANAEAYLKISQGDVVFSNEKLHAVPYAIHAQNGAPTGSITAFTGEADEVPQGWLLCNGASIPSGAYYDKLRELVGNNTPDLRAMFLRGTGENTVTRESDNYSKTYTGTDLGVYVQDQMQQHRHSFDINSSTNGNHRHPIRRDSYGSGDGYAMVSTGGSDESLYNENEALMQNAGNHTHNVNGNTNYQGFGDESRPVNYGVNWIIKI